MTYPTIKHLEANYKTFVALKKNAPVIAGQVILLNQRLLIAAGQLSQYCSKEQYQDFIENTFVGAYYNQWRKERAIGVANMMGMYDRLNVHFGIDDYRGETFYAGIPPITQAEIDAAKIAVNDVEYKFWPVSEKIGIDGEYHPVDRDGEFCPLLDENDIYGDNSQVTLDDLRAVIED